MSKKAFRKQNAKLQHRQNGYVQACTIADKKTGGNGSKGYTRPGSMNPRKK